MSIFDKKTLMRNLSFILLIALSGLFTSCKEGYNFEKESLQMLSTDLQDKFTTDAWYTSIIIRGQNKTHNKITVDVTTDPNSLKQEQWAFESGFWEKKSDISLLIQAGAPTDYMFKIGQEIDFETVSELIDKSLVDLKESENITDILDVRMVSIKSSPEMNNKDEGILYTISIFNMTDGKSYSYVYHANGNLKSKHI